MTDRQHPDSGKLTPRMTAPGRWSAVALALVPLGLFAVAGRLEPSVSGMGTHRQLGLPPCTWKLLVQTRCPACGMTTSWSHFARGDWRQSAATHAGGFSLALLSGLFAAAALRVAWRGRLPTEATYRRFGLAVLAVAGITLADWGWRLLQG